MSVSPTQNFSKPPPVPDWPTVMSTPGFCSWKDSATASVRGPTVLDPSIRISPERPESPLPPPLVLPVPELASSPQAATPRTRRADEARVAASLFVGDDTESPLPFACFAGGPVGRPRPRSQRESQLLLRGCGRLVKRL